MGGVLTQRLLLLAIVALASVFLAQVVATTLFTLPAFSQMESELDRGEVARARLSLERHLRSLKMSTLDYAVWDDGVDFMNAEPGSPKWQKFIDANLPPDTFQYNQFNGFLFLDRSLNPILDVAYEIESGRAIPGTPIAPDQLVHWVSLESGAGPWRQDPKLARTGILRTPGAIVSYAAAYILPSNGIGEPVGTLVGWRYLDRQLFDQIQADLQRPIGFALADQIAASGPDWDLLTKLDGLMPDGHLPRDRDGQLHWLVRDASGQPALIVKQSSAPSLIEKFWWWRPLLVAFGISAVALLAIGTIFSRRVISPLMETVADLDRVSQDADFTLKLQENQWGEIGRLSAAINGLLARIRKQNQALINQNARLERLSRRDSLTGVANRRHLDNVLDDAWAGALKKGRPISVAMIDLDDFKAFNDHYGHQAGDDALVLVARTLRDHLHNATDVVGRYGGEEFCVVLRETDLKGAVTVANRMRDAVSRLKIRHEVSTVGDHLSISVGIASAVPDNVCTIGQVVREADRALYSAKAAGRNRVRTFEENVHFIQPRDRA